MTDELISKLEKAAKHIIVTSATETTSGNYVICPADIPADIISTNMYFEHVGSIEKIMHMYDSVADTEVSPDGSMDTVIHLAYCPNFEPQPEEEDEYPLDRMIHADPLMPMRTTKSIREVLGIPERKPTLMERLEEGRRKAEQQHDPDKKQQKRGQEI